MVRPTSFLSSPFKKQSLQIGEKIWVKNGKKNLDKIAPTFFLCFWLLLFFLFLFFFWFLLCNVGFFLFFFSLVFPGGGFFFFSFFFFFFFNYFFKKTLLEDFLCYFLKCSFSSIHNFLKKYNVLLFVLFKRDIMVNLYKLYFQPNQKFSISPFFHPLNQI